MSIRTKASHNLLAALATGAAWGVLCMLLWHPHNLPPAIIGAAFIGVGFNWYHHRGAP